MDHTRQWPTLNLLDHRVNVARHDAPRQHAIALRIKVKQRALYNLGRFRARQQPLAKVSTYAAFRAANS